MHQGSNMTYMLLTKSLNMKPSSPVVLQPGEVEGYDFTECAEQILQILRALESCNLIRSCPYQTRDDVLACIDHLIADIDLDSDDHQISEFKHIRVEYLDELLAIEVFVGV